MMRMTCKLIMEWLTILDSPFEREGGKRQRELKVRQQMCYNVSVFTSSVKFNQKADLSYVCRGHRERERF